MAGNQLIASVSTGTGNSWHQHATFLNAAGGICHAVIVQHFEGMIPEGVEFLKRNVHHLFPMIVLPLFFGGKEIS